jgi:hypothetical protein
MSDRYRYGSSEWDILEAMTAFGGSFVKQLAVLYRCADCENQRLLESTFRTYFAQYDELAYRRAGALADRRAAMDGCQPKSERTS